MVNVSNADRIVFPERGRTKGNVVAYYERIAPRALPHLLDRPLSIRRFPKGLAEPGFFQKNVPAHYPASIARVSVPRSREASKRHKKTTEPDVTVYPLVREPEHLAYLANQGAIELHVPSSRFSASFRPDKLIIDLDPPAGAIEEVRRAALLVREALARYGLETAPMATGSKGYHVVAAIEPSEGADALWLTAYKFATLLAAAQPDLLTVAFRIALRQGRVFVDWLRNSAAAHAIAPYSLRANARAGVATPLSWDELATVAPDAFTIDDVETLLVREDSLAKLTPGDTQRYVREVDEDFARAGLVLEPFDRFRS
ncbi:MAG TPA: non-homologous end-joining DNA ligase [Polyangiales bacterium]